MLSNLQTRTRALTGLGTVLAEISTPGPDPDKLQDGLSGLVAELASAIDHVPDHNPWFIKANVMLAIKAWSDSLTEEKVLRWIEPYRELLSKRPAKKIGIVMAGNVPLVGFHDLLCSLIAGHRVIARLSSDDDQLMPVLVKIMEYFDQGLAGMVEFTDGRLQDFDAIIATGSNNTSRYFEYYFGKYPNIIRKNRNGVGVISGNETDEELRQLGMDIFTHFGLGCRNISKLYVPVGYNFDNLLMNLAKYEETGDHHKYRNNYDYYKSIFLVNNTRVIDNGFALFREDASLNSPISVIHFEYYDDVETLNRQLMTISEGIQCIVSVSPKVSHAIRPGTSQQPELWDYADDVDTVGFLVSGKW